MDKKFIVILLILILGLGGLFFFTRDKASAPGNNTEAASKVSNHVIGNKSSKVSLVVYGDFECSACYAIFPVEKAVVDKYINDITFTFRHFPLDGIHKNARSSSRAAEAAGMQDKFFEMHHLLYENYNSWVSLNDPLETFLGLAKSLGLDIEKFKTDYASEAVNATINADIKEGTAKNVAGTPTYFLNDKELELKDIQTFDQFSAKIEAAIKDTNK
jgi:protein-disulfide isomerase